MQITRTSIFSGNTNTMIINVTPSQMSDWEQGMLIQDAMPQLTPDEREFIMSGITPKEWADNFGEE